MLPERTPRTYMPQRLPDRQVCVCVCIQDFREGQNPKVGWGRGDKGEKRREGRSSALVTDSCQESESAVCKPHTQNDMHATPEALRDTIKPVFI